MERQRQGPCGGFDKVEAKVFSLSFCFPNGSLGGFTSVGVRTKSTPTYPLIQTRGKVIGG